MMKVRLSWVEYRTADVWVENEDNALAEAMTVDPDKSLDLAEVQNFELLEDEPGPDDMEAAKAEREGEV